MRVARPKPAQSPSPEPLEQVISTLTVPDALLAWGRAPERVMLWPRDWSREVSDLAERSQAAPLSESECEVLLSRLEALVVEAAHAGRSDLLVGLDVQTAEWLALRYELPFGGRQVSVGAGGYLAWSEVRVLHDAYESAMTAREAGEERPDPKALGAVALRAKDLISDVFPDAKLGAVSPLGDDPPCASCGRPLASVSILTDFGSEYCSGCWSQRMSREAPPPPAKRKSAR